MCVGRVLGVYDVCWEGVGGVWCVLGGCWGCMVCVGRVLGVYGVCWGSVWCVGGGVWCVLGWWFMVCDGGCMVCVQMVCVGEGDIGGGGGVLCVLGWEV